MVEIKRRQLDDHGIVWQKSRRLLRKLFGKVGDYDFTVRQSDSVEDRVEVFQNDSERMDRGVRHISKELQPKAAATASLASGQYLSLFSRGLMTLLDETLRTSNIPAERLSQSIGAFPPTRIPAPRSIMNSQLLTGITALGCVLLASCYPYNENQNKKPVTSQQQKPLTAVEQKKVQAERDQMKMKDEAKKKEDLANGLPSGSGATTSPSGDLPKPPSPSGTTAKPEYKFASKVPGQEGFVLSPYNGKKIDVRDIPSGTLVQDPTYTGDGKGYFRVP